MLQEKYNLDGNKVILMLYCKLEIIITKYIKQNKKYHYCNKNKVFNNN